MTTTGPDSPIEHAPPVAVVLAAGEGRRLRDGSARTPKPLIRLVGLSLAERCICGFLQEGIRRFVVILGHQAERVRSHFEEIGRRRGCEIAFEVAEQWSLGNGSSTLAARAVVGDRPFLLTMVDHLLSSSMIKAILASPPSADEIALAIDGRKEEIFDLADLTKIREQHGRVSAIGKDLSEWDAGDTGLFYCSAAIFSALERARDEGLHSLTDGVRECVANGGVRAVDVSGETWLDVDTSEARREGERRLRASLSKGQDDGFVSQYVNRAISRPLSMLLARTPVTPDQITVASFLLGVLGAGFLVLANSSFWIAGGIMIQVASIVDGCDGEVARLKHRSSARGGWLDTVLDRYADTALAFAVTLAAARVDPSSWVWIAGCLSAIGFLMTSYTTKEYQIRFERPYPNTLVARLKRRDLRILIVAVGAVAGHPFAALLTAGLFSHASVLWILSSAWRGNR